MHHYTIYDVNILQNNDCFMFINRLVNSNYFSTKLMKVNVYRPRNLSCILNINRFLGKRQKQSINFFKNY